MIHDKIDTTAEAQMPLGYLIPMAWKAFADELALQGVEMERITKAVDRNSKRIAFRA